MAEEIKTFIQANDSQLKAKDERGRDVPGTAIEFLN